MESPLDPIRVYPGKPGRIALHIPFSEDRLVRIKTVSGSRWEPREQHWTVPRTARDVERLLDLFSGDEIEVDPVLLGPRPPHPGQRPPIRVAPGEARETVQALADELRRRKRSPQTVKVYTLHVKRLLQHLDKPPRDIRPEEVRAYFRNMVLRERIARSYYHQALSAVRFFYRHVLHAPEPPLGTPDVRLRQALPSDASAIHDLHLRAVRTLCSGHYTSEQIAAWLRNRTPEGYLDGIRRKEMYVAERDGALAGFGHAVPGEVLAVFVDPAFVGQGIGAQLLLHGLHIAGRDHPPAIELIASLNAVPFYEKFGFVRIGPNPVHRNGLDLPFVRMRKTAEP